MARSTRLRNPTSLALALARAHARRRNAGAVMFIVVVTLGLLAAMGVYGLSAASADVKAAGHMREALQAQRAGEYAVIMTAETLNPQGLVPIIQQMRNPTDRTANCKTAAALPGGFTSVPPGSMCSRLTETGMRNASPNVNAWVVNPSPPATAPNSALASDSFGAVKSIPNVNVEVSNPFDVDPPPGFVSDSNMGFAQVIVTVYVDVRSTVDLTAPSQAIVAGRGRLTVGPIPPIGGKYP